MLKDLLYQIFSEKCQLVSFRLDLFYEGSIYINPCLLFSSFNSISTSNNVEYSCKTLRYANIRLHYACFIEYVIRHAPNLERLSICLQTAWCRNQPSDFKCGTSQESNETCSYKVKSLLLFCMLETFPGKMTFER